MLSLLLLYIQLSVKITLKVTVFQVLVPVLDLESLVLVVLYLVLVNIINTGLDYCNSLYFGIADGLTSRLQSVQDVAARLIAGVSRCEHITPNQTSPSDNSNDR